MDAGNVVQSRLGSTPGRPGQARPNQLQSHEYGCLAVDVDSYFYRRRYRVWCHDAGLAQATEGYDNTRGVDREMSMDKRLQCVDRGLDEKLAEQKVGLMPFSNRFLTRRGTSLREDGVEEQPYADAHR